MTEQAPQSRAAGVSVETLMEALPYIREFHGRTVVIKYGGAAMREEELREAFATDVVLLKYVGINPIVVHGGGPEISEYMDRLGMEVRFHEGLRVSDAETVEVAQMVLLGKLNSDIVQRLNRHGQPAVGLSGSDGSMFEVAPVANAEQVGFVGSIERVDVDVLNHIAADYIPVDRILGLRSQRPVLQRQRRRGRGQGRRRARRAQGDLPHRRRGLARRRRRRVLADLARDGRRGRRAAVRHRRGHAPQARRLRRRDPRRCPVGPHHRRPQAAFSLGRALHRCRDRNDGDPMNLTDLQALEERYLMRTYRRAPVEFVRGEGALLWDAEGKEYLDFLAGISVCSVGHCNPDVVEAVREQAGRLMHASNLFYTEPMVRLAERLSESSLGGRVFFSNSGTEANECAIKIARKHAHRRGIEAPEIVSFERDFHGRTYGALSATPALAANPALAPMLPGFRSVPLNDADALRDAVGESTAAVLIEPIQGEAGIYPVSEEALLAASRPATRAVRC